MFRPAHHLDGAQVSPRCWVYARCSGEEKDTGQDVQAQLAQVAARCRVLGYEVAGASVDEGVSGDVHPSERRGFNAAFLAVSTGKADVLVIRDASRFSRCYPTQALDAFNEFAQRGLKLLCLADPQFNTVDGLDERPATVLVRFVVLWQSWAALVGIRESTQQVMAEILSGRRSTKSGLPPGRPSVDIDPEHLAAAQAIIAGGGTLAAAHREVLRLRGHADALDPKTRRKKYVGLSTLGRALGLPAYVQKSPPSKTEAALLDESSQANGSVVEGG